MKKVVLAIVGALFILIGIIGLFIPVLPGFAFVFLGLSFIAPKLAERLKRRVLRKFSKQEIVYIKRWHRAGVHAGFTTRHFPLFLSKTDDLLDPENRLKFKKLMKPASGFALLNQVHGNRVISLDDQNPHGQGGFYDFKETDGVITNQRDLMLLVMTADCLPIFYKASEWVGLVHAGWQGTKGEIAKKAYQVLKQKSGCRNSQIQILFGPCIGFGQYEVGPEFRGMFPKKSLREKKGRLYFDLAGENKRQLLAAGAYERNITELDLCTVEENEDYYSFRKEKDAAGRMVSFIMIS